MKPRTSRWLWAVLAIAAQAGMALSAHAAEPAQVVHGDYLCGGVGDEGLQAMRDLRQPYNLRMKFAQVRTGDFLAGVSVRVEPQGAAPAAAKPAIGPIEDCGPVMYLRLEPGRYRISATYGDVTLKRNVRVGRSPTEHVLYWPGK
ncbi:MAG: hypothetical protein RL459_1819 [Pseudomonadota bacterium]